MKNNIYLPLVALLILSVFVLPCWGIEQGNLDTRGAQQKLAEISAIDLEKASMSDIELFIQQVQPLEDYGKQCIVNLQFDLDQLDKAIAALGKRVKGEEREITRERVGLVAVQQQKEAELAQCRLLAVRASELDDKLQEYKKTLFTRDLLARGPNLVSIVRSDEVRSLRWLQVLQGYFFTRSEIDRLFPWRIVPVFLITLLGMALGYGVDSLLRHYTGSVSGEGLFFDILGGIGQRNSIFFLPVGLAGLIVAVHAYLPHQEPPPYTTSLLSSILLALVLATAGKIFIQTVQQNTDKVIDKATLSVDRLGRIRLYFLAGCSGLLWFIYTSPLKSVLTEEPFFLLRSLSMLLWYASVLWCFWQVCQLAKFDAWRKTSRFILGLLLGTGMIAELFGYHSLAAHLLIGIVGTLFFFFLFVFANYVAGEILGGLGRGKYPWQREIRSHFGIKQRDVLKGIIWTASLLKLLFFLVFIYGILRLWGISRVYSSSFSDWLVNGFTIGKVSIVPSRIGIGLLFVSIGWTVVALLKDKVIRIWLADSELHPSLQDTLTTVFGYIGFSIVILLGLSTAGIDFSGLAIIVGALSVGLGFGLQNIVNNLISGLILLFERPIKRGDWVIVGTTEGYVKKISVRSTIIQTFDRSDVIVPNSELISNQVTNMMLRDSRGRVRVPVGVAYGSDTELVRDLLLEIANAHPEVITNGSVPLPVVRFQAFGDSSLDFELYCHIKDVDKRLDVRSDIHFAIDKAFQKHGLEIPFPQRDLHLRSGLGHDEAQQPPAQEKVLQETETGE